MRDEGMPQNCWKIAHLEEVLPDEDGLVRKVCVKIADSNLDHNGPP